MLATIADEVIIEIAQRGLRSLYQSYAGKRYAGTTMIFPRTRHSASMRVSEQEFRQAFILAMVSWQKARKNFVFSIETPTSQRYSFSGKGTRSALTDLTLYNKSNQEKILNIEFKSGNARFSSVRKDIEKLLRESTSGGFFQLFESSDNKSLATFLKKLNRALEMLTKEACETRSILFIIAVLDKGYLYSHSFVLNHGKPFLPRLEIEPQAGSLSGWQEKSFAA